MQNVIQTLHDIDYSKLGHTLYLRDNGSFFPLLRVEYMSWVRDDISNGSIHAEFVEANSKGLPWLPRSEASVYIKTPPGALYEAHGIADRIELINGTHDIPHYLDESNSIFCPYLSWHGGIDVTEPKGTISLRGLTHLDTHTHRAYNEAPAIAKYDFAGYYTPIASVILPTGLVSLPGPAKISAMKHKQISAMKYQSTFQHSIVTTDPKAIIIDRALIKKNSSLQITYFVHSPGPLHSSKFSQEQQNEWIFDPISFTPAENVPLAISMIGTSVESSINPLVNNQFIFIGYSSQPSKNLIFTARKIS